MNTSSSVPQKDKGVQEYVPPVNRITKEEVERVAKIFHDQGLRGALPFMASWTQQEAERAQSTALGLALEARDAATVSSLPSKRIDMVRKKFGAFVARVVPGLEGFAKKEPTTEELREKQRQMSAFAGMLYSRIMHW